MNYKLIGLSEQQKYEANILSSFHGYRLADYGIKSPVLPPHTVDIMFGLKSCNNRCLGCPGGHASARGTKELTPEGWHNVIQNILSFVVGGRYVKELHFSHNWSDPLMNPLLKDLVEQIRQDPIYRIIFVITNGLLASKRAETLAQTDVVNISINGTASKNYAYFHGVDAYEKVLEGAKRISDLAKVINPRLNLISSLVLREEVLPYLTDHLQRLAESGFKKVVVRQDFYEKDEKKKENMARIIFEYAQKNTPIPIIMKGFTDIATQRSPVCAAMRYWATVDSQGNLIHCIHNTDNDYGLAADLEHEPLENIWQRMFKYGIANNGAFHCKETCCPTTIGMLNSLDAHDLNSEGLKQSFTGINLNELQILDGLNTPQLITDNYQKVDLGGTEAVNKSLPFTNLCSGRIVVDTQGKTIGTILLSTGTHYFHNNEGKLIAIGYPDKNNTITYYEVTQKNTVLDATGRSIENIYCRETTSKKDPNQKIFADNLGNAFATTGENVLVEFDPQKQLITASRTIKTIPEADRTTKINEVRLLSLTSSTAQKLATLVALAKTINKSFPKSFMLDPFPMILNTNDPENQPINLKQWVAFKDDEISRTRKDGTPTKISAEYGFTTPNTTITDWDKSIRNLFLNIYVLKESGLLAKDITYDEIVDWLTDSLTTMHNLFLKDKWAYFYLTKQTQEPVFISTSLKIYLQRGLSFSDQLLAHLNPEKVTEFRDYQKTMARSLMLSMPYLPRVFPQIKSLYEKIQAKQETEEEFLQAWEILKTNSKESIPDYIVF